MCRCTMANNNQERVRQWLVNHFVEEGDRPVAEPADLQIHLITNGDGEYPQSHDTKSMVSSNLEIQVDEVTSTTENTRNT